MAPCSPSPSVRIVPARLDILLYRRDSFDLVLYAYGVTDDGLRGDPWDWTGYTGAEFVIFDPDDQSGAPLDELTQANGRLVLGGTAGTIGLHTDLADVEAYTWTAGGYFLRVTDPDGVTQAIQGGDFVLTMDAPPCSGGC